MKTEKSRCPWPTDELYLRYHDEEWGVPVHDDRLLFEYLILEGAQAGLSWRTVLNKRENYRAAFDNFEAEKIARYGEAKKAKLMGNPGIIRNRLKIQAAILNAKAFLKVREEFGSFDAYLWRFVDGKPILNHPKRMKEVPARTKNSDAMSKDLLQRGFKFVGSTICYAHMQAVGMVNDHLVHLLPAPGAFMKRLAVYCGSNQGARPEYAAAAQALGALLAREKIELVYGGGCVGLMGFVADAVLAHGGHVIGVIPEKLVIKEVVHEKLPDLRVVKTMHERKALMAELADGFIALPGGYGTFEEFFEVLAWGQLGWHQKPFGLLNIGAFYTPLIRFLDHTTTEGFIRPKHRELIILESDPGQMLQRMMKFRPPAEIKWANLIPDNPG